MCPRAVPDLELGPAQSSFSSFCKKNKQTGCALEREKEFVRGAFLPGLFSLGTERPLEWRTSVYLWMTFWGS